MKHDSQPQNGTVQLPVESAVDLVLPKHSPSLGSGTSSYDTDQVILRAETLSKQEAKVQAGSLTTFISH